MVVRPEKPRTSFLTAQDLFLTVKTPVVVKVGMADLTWQWGSTKFQIEWWASYFSKKGKGDSPPPSWARP